MALTVGTRLGPYEILALLGTGGMGAVYKARDSRLARLVAIKVLAADLTRDGTATQRFLLEARAASALDHPNICTIYDVGETPESQLYLVMAHYDGETLKQKIARGPLALTEVIEIVGQVGRGLAEAHRAGIVHRDIKPANLFLTKGGAAKILDFGLAKLVGAEGITQTGTTVGTVAYMSPEQAQGEEVDHRSDIWSLGVVLYEMLTGLPPFAGDNLLSILRAILEREPRPLPVSASAVQGVVSHALKKSRAQRYQSVIELLGELETTKCAATLPALPSPRDTPFIAVLPFANLSPDPENAFFADGLTEEVITDLSRVRGLRVISRNSSLQLKGTPKDTRTIGRELGVRYILGGSVRRIGERLRVTSQLVEAETDTQLWAERFTGTTADIFEIQEQIARKISDALAVRLSGDELRRLTRQPFRDVHAYEWYLRARRLNFESTSSTIVDGLIVLEKAIEREGEHAGLLALKGYLLWNRNQIVGGSGADLTAATRYVDRALALDPELATALVARAMLEIRQPVVDSALLLRLLHRAYANEPTTDACLWLTIYLSQTGRPEQALVFAEEGARIDPLSGIAAFLPCFAKMFIGRHDEALTESRQIAKQHPHDVVTRFWCGQIAATIGERDEALATLPHGTGGDMWGKLSALYRDALEGRISNVERLVQEDSLRNLGLVDDQFGWAFAQALGAVGAHDEAMWWLRHSAERGFVNARFVRDFDRMLAPLRVHPDMPGLLAYMERRAEVIARAADQTLEGLS